jgi:hypothetical protein
MQLRDMLHSQYFPRIFSFILGVFIILLARPACKDGKCFGYKAPAVSEIRDHAYKIEDRCYKFVAKDAKCPVSGVIEPFQWTAPSASKQ